MSKISVKILNVLKVIQKIGGIKILEFINQERHIINLDLNQNFIVGLSLNIFRIFLEYFWKVTVITVIFQKSSRNIPIIFTGGAGHGDHFIEALQDSRINAVATANLLNFLGNGLEISRKKVEKKINLPIWL